jgi:hypothetical protein
MKLIIDNIVCEAMPGESLYDIVKRLGFVNGKLSNDPIAAKISGRVFTLGYVPVREKDVTPERRTIRTAIGASGGVVKLLRYSDPQGREAYMRTAQFVIFLAYGKKHFQQVLPSQFAQFISCHIYPPAFSMLVHGESCIVSP